MFDNIARWAPDGGHIRLAQPRGRLDQRVERGRQIERRAADDLEHVGGGSLLLQRFAQLVEQPRILDGDDGLTRKIRNKLNLLLGERAYLLSINSQHTDHCVILEQRNSNQGPSARSLIAARRIPLPWLEIAVMSGT